MSRPPFIPPNWYLVARSRDLQRKPLPITLGDQELVLFRTSTGVGALQAHCSHLGTHLKHGTIEEDRLVCPLHRWRYSAQGHCQIPGRCQPAFPVREKHGALFVATQPLEEMPTTPDFPTRIGKPWKLHTPWQAVAANGFDAQHLAQVHGRRVIDGPHVVESDHVLTVNYTSQVIGSTLADRLTRHLTGNHIEVRLTCSRGTWLSMESRFGQYRSFLIVSLLPTGENTCQAWPLYGLENPYAVSLGWWFVKTFLQQDLAILRDIRWNPRLQLPQDALLRQLLDFLAQTSPPAEQADARLDPPRASYRLSK